MTQTTQSHRSVSRPERFPVRGKFIVLEGGDGSGKSSAVRFLKEKLKGANVIFTREPGGVESAEEMRETLVKKRAEELDVFTQILLFEAGRREHVTKKILPALESGNHVICDRFSASTYGYQIVAGKGQQYEKLFFALDEIARGGLQPDLTLFLDIDPAMGFSRKQKSGDVLNVFDMKEAEFYTHIREGLKKYLADKPHAVIDAEKPIGEVQRDIVSAISAALHI